MTFEISETVPNLSSQGAAATNVPSVTISQVPPTSDMLEFSPAFLEEQERYLISRPVRSTSPFHHSSSLVVSSSSPSLSQGAISRPIRSHSLTPNVGFGQSGGCGSVAGGNGNGGRSEQGSFWGARPIVKNRSFSITFGVKDPSHGDDPNRIVEHSGMKDLKEWMKSLRLHKYTDRLADLSYEELLSLSDQHLKERLFTEGAKGKFLKQVAFIKERPARIREIRQQLEEITELRELLTVLPELDKLILMPLKPTMSKTTCSNWTKLTASSNPVMRRAPNFTVSELSRSGFSDHQRHDSGSDSGTEMADDGEDIPQDLFDLLEKTFSIIICKQRDDCDKDRVVLHFFKLLERRCMKKEAFTAQHKQMFHTWMKRMNQVWDITNTSVNQHISPPTSFTEAMLESKRRFERNSSRDVPLRRASLQPPMPCSAVGGGGSFLRGPSPPSTLNMSAITCLQQQHQQQLQQQQQQHSAIPTTCCVPPPPGLYPSELYSSSAMAVQRRSVPEINPPNFGVHQIKRNSYQGDHRMPPLFDSEVLTNVYEGQPSQQQQQQQQQQLHHRQNSLFGPSPYLSHSPSFSSSSSSSQSRRASTMSWDSGYSRRSSTMSSTDVSRRNSSISEEFETRPPFQSFMSVDGNNPNSRRDSSTHCQPIMSSDCYLSVDSARRNSTIGPHRLTPSSGCPSDDGSTDSLEHDLHKLSLSVTESLLE